MAVFYALLKEVQRMIVGSSRLICMLCGFYSADVSESFNGATTIPHRDFTKSIQVFAASWPLVTTDNPQLRSQIITLPETLSSHLIVPSTFVTNTFESWALAYRIGRKLPGFEPASLKIHKDLHRIYINYIATSPRKDMIYIPHAPSSSISSTYVYLSIYSILRSSSGQHRSFYLLRPTYTELEGETQGDCDTTEIPLVASTLLFCPGPGPAQRAPGTRSLVDKLRSLTEPQGHHVINRAVDAVDLTLGNRPLCHHVSSKIFTVAFALSRMVAILRIYSRHDLDTRKHKILSRQLVLVSVLIVCKRFHFGSKY
ncbi:hypothetical protein GG344DRAFT_62366 [Lentinula edodes]|nr:hypothetical protein GG344DRAFT_62366 [Lentinula edodes]